MKTHKALSAALASFTLLALIVPRVGTHADEGDLQSVLITAKERALEGESHLLRYKFDKGDVVQWKVRQLGTTEARVRGNTQTSKMRAISTKQWEITDVDQKGNITFVHSVLDVDMWQKVSDRQEVSYDSTQDKTPPPEYVQVAKTVGVPIATVTMTPTGQIIKRDKAPIQYNSGLGEIAVPLPIEAVKTGQKWHLSNQVRVRAEDGKVLRIKTRLVYTLEAVKTGVATIAVRTEVLTPVNDPKVKSDLVQQLIDGHLKFDIDAGRVISQEINWDETVVGFSGNDSLMKYLARFTEELIPADKMAQDSADATVR
jgi:hypothetical protein